MEHSIMESLCEVRDSRVQGENGREKGDSVYVFDLFILPRTS